MRIVDVNTVYADGTHNAFTDLVRFGESYFLAFRSCPDGHMIFSSSQIVILQSTDGEAWREVARYGVSGEDLRDPHFLSTGERLFVYSGAWPVKEGSPSHKSQEEMNSYVVYTDDGLTWSNPQVAKGSKGYYFWRCGYHQGTCYMTAKRRHPDMRPVTPEDKSGFQTLLLRSDDGLDWEEVSVIVPEYGDETAIQFEEDGTLVALARHRNVESGALLCVAQPPYDRWSRSSLSYNVGGPLLAKVGGKYLVSGRRMREGEERVTALYWLTNGDLTEFAVLPCHGDNSYPGFVQTGPGEGLLSYYSNRRDAAQGKPPSDIHVAYVQWSE